MMKRSLVIVMMPDSMWENVCFFFKKNFIRYGNVKVLVRVQDKELKIYTSGTHAQVEMQISELLACRTLFSLFSNVILWSWSVE